jgi:hypothetical protein
VPSPTKYIEGLGLRYGRPRPNPAAEMGRHKLSPEEGFIYSRVDGNTSYGQICAISGLGEKKTAEILIRLKTMKLILGEGEPMPVAKSPASEPVAPPAAEPRTEPGPPPTIERPVRVAAEGKKTEEPRSILATLDDHSSVDPILLTEGPALDETFKMRILRVHRRLAELNPYQLLGLAPGADKKDLKRAYFLASKEFHPDRYYGKNLGPYQQMLVDIFDKTSKGFEALMAMDDAKRAALDDLLRKRSKSTSAADRRR